MALFYMKYHLYSFTILLMLLKHLLYFWECNLFGLQDRYSTLKEKYDGKNLKEFEDAGHERGIALEKSLSAALDSFDNLFCRRCLV